MQLRQVLVGAIAVSGKTKWEMLDGIVRRVFKEFVLRVDPVTNLGLNMESVYCYSIGDIVRMKGTFKNISVTIFCPVLLKYHDAIFHVLCKHGKYAKITMNKFVIY